MRGLLGDSSALCRIERSTLSRQQCRRFFIRRTHVSQHGLAAPFEQCELRGNPALLKRRLNWR